MKQKSIIYEIIIFSLILIFLIIPPFFNAPVTDATALFNWSFPIRQAGLCAFAVVLYLLSKNLNNAQAEKKRFFYPSMIVLSVMFFTSLIIKVITKSGIRSMSGLLPVTGFEWFCCFITFAFSAFYEEIIYRFYFTDALRRIFEFFTISNNSNTSNKKVIICCCEAVGLLVFAFAHFYLGIAAVINAAVAHIALRILYKKTNLIFNCFLIHFIYNIISLILL